jgi:hypothetical protein
MVWDWRESGERLFFDTGAPLWPYQAPAFLLLLLNAPAILLSHLAMLNNRLWEVPTVYIVQLPFVVAWWWFIGTRFDFGLVKPRTQRSAMIVSVILAALMAACVFFLASEVRDYASYRLFMTSHGWRPGWPIRFVMDTGFMVWSVALIPVCSAAIAPLRNDKQGGATR